VTKTFIYVLSGWRGVSGDKVGVRCCCGPADGERAEPWC